MKIAFLASKVTLPDSPIRRADAHEHDYQVETLSGPMKTKGMDLIPIDWMDEVSDWSVFDAAIIGTTWDYWDQPEAFLSKLTRLEESGIRVFNPPNLVAWNSRKTYLRDLADRGAPMIPTLWASHPSAAEIEAAFDTFDTEDIVIKRQIGAGAHDQLRIRKGDVIADYPFDAMIQPFLPCIQTEGELSFIMIDGELSHALLKKAKTGDYRIQSLYGGIEEKIYPSKQDIEAAKQVLACLDDIPLYARVDMVRMHGDDLTLMELELIEPYLYPEQADRLGEMMADALEKRLK